MSLPMLFNLRLLSMRPSNVQPNGCLVEIVISSMAGPGLDSSAKLLCEFHPQADDGAHWGVYPPEVRMDSRFSLLSMLLGENPSKTVNGEPAPRYEFFKQMFSRSLNEFHEQRSCRAILPDELATLLHNTVFKLESDHAEPPLVLRPTGIAQADLLHAMCELSPEKFGAVPSYYIEPLDAKNPLDALMTVDLRHKKQQ